MESLIGEAIVCQDGEVGRLTYVVDPDTGSITDLIVTIPPRFW